MIAEMNPSLVIGILTEPGHQAGGAVQSVGKTKLGDEVRLDVAVRSEGQTGLDYAQTLQATYPGSHLLLLAENVFVPSSFLEAIERQIRFFADRDVAWGVIGNSGITFPYFKPVHNLLGAGAPADRFTGVLPAALLGPELLLIHGEVELQAFARTTGCPADGPVSDFATIAAWEAEKPCWICNLPVYVDGPPGSERPPGDGGAWARYLATRYNNASFITSFGTITLSDQAADAKDYYYSQVEPALNRATSHLDTASVSVLLFATYYDPDVFDRCLMSIVSQFQRPAAIYVISLNRLEETRFEVFRTVLDRYRHYLPIHWSEEEQTKTAAIDQAQGWLRRIPDDGFSMVLYDTFALFPHAVRQICEFLQFTLRDEHVLPITTAEISRLQRTVEIRYSSRRQPFFKEIEKFGFSHKERWLASQPSSTLHFTFPNRFLRETSLASIDLFDLGSTLPQRLLSEPLSFFLIERGAGYMSFQKPSPDETVSLLTEDGNPLHLANKAASLMAARSNVIQYSMGPDGIKPTLSYRDEDEAWRKQNARVVELVAYRDQSERDIARLHYDINQRETLLNEQRALLKKLRDSHYFRLRRKLKKFGLVQFLYKLVR